MNIIGGVIWHYWLAVPLVVVGVVSLIAALIGYLGKVSSTRYPKRLLPGIPVERYQASSVEGMTVDWGLAEKVANQIANRAPFNDVSYLKGLNESFSGFTSTAEKLVETSTGLKSFSGEARAKVVDRSGWIRANFSSLKRLLKPVMAEDSEMKKASISSRVAALEIGAVLGWMSTRVLGQYDLLVLDNEDLKDQDLVYYVGPNICAIERRYAFDPDGFRLWLAIHELTHRAQFTGVSWMREHYLSLVKNLLQEVQIVTDESEEKNNSQIKLLKDPGSSRLTEFKMSNFFTAMDQKDSVKEIAALMTLLEGHGDVIMSRAGKGHVKNQKRFEKVVSQRRKSASGATKIFQKIIGIEAKLAQYEQGEEFIYAIEELEGMDFLNMVWEHPDNLPKLEEIKDPNLWIARIKRLSNE